jgi:tRNA-modifying protein YgfZ
MPDTALTTDLTVSTDELRLLQEGRVAAMTGDALFHVQGSGSLACLQGLLTNDVVKGHDRAAVWGALLTPKGMIITDAWVLRDGTNAWVTVPAAAREAASQLFTRTMPPRLAKVSDRSDTMSVWWATNATPQGSFVPGHRAPFSAIALGERDTAPAAVSDATVRSTETADALRLLAGWPTLGREIDERTLPQEAGFDELRGIVYDKGCYTGQETMARLHFRGHANRQLLGVVWNGDAAPAHRDIEMDGKNVGTVRTVARIGEHYFGLAIVRREVAVGNVVLAGGVPAQMIVPPFTAAQLAG